MLPDRVLAIVLNQVAEGELTFGYDVGGWLDGATFTCTRFVFLIDREMLAHDAPVSGTLRTGQLKPLEMTIFEFRRKEMVGGPNKGS